jgi:DNA-binding CsgD family transcriptional regulator
MSLAHSNAKWVLQHCIHNSIKSASLKRQKHPLINSPIDWEGKVNKISNGASAAHTTSDLLDLVGNIYQAGLEPERWTAVLRRMSQFFQADMACIYTPAPALPEHAIYLTHNFSDSSQAEYAAYYHQQDAWTLAAQKKKIYIQGTLTLGEQLISFADLHHTEFYNDFLKPNGMEWIVTTALFDGLADPRAPATHMTFTRHPDHATFGSEQTRLLEQLAPHVRRALLTYWHLTEAKQLSYTHQDALECLGYGLILLDDSGKVMHQTPLAERLTCQGHGLTLQNDRPRAPHPDDHDALNQLIHQALLGLGGGLQLRPTHKAVADSPPWRISVLPVREGQTLPPGMPLTPFQRPGVLLLIHAPGHPDVSPSKNTLQTFAALHRLTPAELRVLQGLLHDRAPKQIAGEQNVSIKTVRTQLSSLYTKTGTRNQRELVRAAMVSVL